jgi:hypothetical protein
MNNNMTVLTATLSTLHLQLQNTTHAMLSQRKEKMISDKAHAINMHLFNLKSRLDRAQMDEDRNLIQLKMKQLGEMCECLRDAYKTIGTGITNMLTGPIQSALPAPSAPPGLANPSMPPPPPPLTPLAPTTHRNYNPPPTPTPTPLANNGKRAESSNEEPSLTKRIKMMNAIKMTNAPSRSSPRHRGTRPGRTPSESSVENALTLKNPKAARKD